MIQSQNAPAAANDEAVAATRASSEAAKSQWQVEADLEQYRAETERLRVLADFLARPVHAHGGADPDPDIVTAYNLAVEAALQGIRRAAGGS